MTPTKMGIQVHSHADMFCDLLCLVGVNKVSLTRGHSLSPFLLHCSLEYRCNVLILSHEGYIEDGGAPQLKNPGSLLTAFTELITLVSKFNQQ